MKIRIIFAALAIMFVMTADVGFVKDQPLFEFDLHGEAEAPLSSRVHWIKLADAFDGLGNVLFSNASNTMRNESNYACRTARSPFSDIGGIISKKLLTVVRDAQANAYKKYNQEYLVSITEGGKDTINVPSHLKEWDDAIDHLLPEIV
ncbi:MAG: hypothetical protein LBI74_00680 [Synergistaceae bacterium]|nr:hypothetical protein [Synergistaceae bacterium]